MDAYLEIAEKILRSERRPLSARQIIDAAYSRQIMPPQLHGRTQHKTLGARLSEDILARRERSLFFRTAPGRFFLKSLLSDESIDPKFKQAIIARRRQRELARGRHLVFSADWVSHYFNHDCISARDFFAHVTPSAYRYMPRHEAGAAHGFSLWAFVLVAKAGQVLTYRHGRYRENRDAFFQRRSVGFYTPVVDIDADLFEARDLGMSAAGLKAVVLDLDLPGDKAQQYEANFHIDYFISEDRPSSKKSLLAVSKFECPTWFEPLSRHLALNDLRWMSLLALVNDTQDFDPWSQSVLSCVQKDSIRETPD